LIMLGKANGWRSWELIFLFYSQTINKQGKCLIFQHFRKQYDLKWAVVW